MAQRRENGVLFLCTANYYRSRFAEVLFNSVAGKMGLPWQASSRGLALERGVNNVGPMAVEAITALEALGVRAAEAVTRLPAQVTADDLQAADFIVALKGEEHLPLLQERFPAWAEKVEYWQVDDAPEALLLAAVQVAASSPWATTWTQPIAWSCCGVAEKRHQRCYRDCPSSRRRFSTSSGSAGLTRCRSNPAASQRLRSSSNPCAVIAMSRRGLSRNMARSCRAT
jgi:protein-tyrosine phosphatase